MNWLPPAWDSQLTAAFVVVITVAAPVVFVAVAAAVAAVVAAASWNLSLPYISFSTGLSTGQL